MLVSSKTKIAGVVGDPISHSLSPKLHNYLLEKNQIDGIYLPFKVAAEDLHLCLTSFAKLGFKGCNVTIPHKEAALKICHKLSDGAKIIGAVNTIIIDENKMIHGDNSDCDGFINNIKQTQPNFIFKDKKAVLLGAGGAARAIIFGLITEKISHLTIINRDLERAKNLIADFKKSFSSSNYNIEIMGWEQSSSALNDCDLLINSTSLGMVGGQELKIDLKNLPINSLVADIVYHPLMTKLLLTAQKRGNPIVTGIRMLINQALVGFTAWYGMRPQIDQELVDKMIEWSL